MMRVAACGRIIPIQSNPACRMRPRVGDIGHVRGVLGEVPHKLRNRRSIAGRPRKRLKFAVCRLGEGYDVACQRDEGAIGRSVREPFERFLTSLERRLLCAERAADALRLRDEAGLRWQRLWTRCRHLRVDGRARRARGPAARQQQREQGHGETERRFEPVRHREMFPHAVLGAAGADCAAAQ
jgi:hypothetical protein